MANDDTNLIECPLCGIKDSLECKRGFLGFTKCFCSSCGKHFERRLNTGYRVTYWLLGIWTSFVLLSNLPSFINALSIGLDLFLNIVAEYSFFILFAVGSFLAINKDFKIKREITKNTIIENEQL